MKRCAICEKTWWRFPPRSPLLTRTAMLPVCLLRPLGAWSTEYVAGNEALFQVSVFPFSVFPSCNNARGFRVCNAVEISCRRCRDRCAFAKEAFCDVTAARGSYWARAVFAGPRHSPRLCDVSMLHRSIVVRQVFLCSRSSAGPVLSRGRRPLRVLMGVFTDAGVSWCREFSASSAVGRSVPV